MKTEVNFKKKFFRTIKVLSLIFTATVSLHTLGQSVYYSADIYPVDSIGMSKENVIYYDVSHPCPDIVYLFTGKHDRCPDSIEIKSTLMKSTDGGDTWEIVFSHDSAIFVEICFFDEMHGLASRAVGSSKGHDSLMATSDGGYTWKAISEPVLDIKYITKDSVLGKNLSNALMFSSDGGHSWSVIFQSVTNYSYVDGCIYALDGIALPWTNDLFPGVGVYKTKNFGKMWLCLKPKGAVPGPYRIPYKITDIFFYEEGKGALFGSTHTYTKDDFNSYTIINTLGYRDQFMTSKYLKNGYGLAAVFHDDPYNENALVLSKDFGQHKREIRMMYNSWHVEGGWITKIDACEEDTTFFFTVSLPNNHSLLYRVTPSVFDSLNLVPLDVPVRENIVSVTVSPNPADNAFRVVSESPLKQVVVYDLLGKEVFRRSYSGETATEIAVSAWPSGTYIVKVVAKDGHGEAKLVKR